jgi:hypothetical protein
MGKETMQRNKTKLRFKGVATIGKNIKTAAASFVKVIAGQQRQLITATDGSVYAVNSINQVRYWDPKKGVAHAKVLDRELNLTMASDGKGSDGVRAFTCTCSGCKEVILAESKMDHCILCASDIDDSEYEEVELDLPSNEELDALEEDEDEEADLDADLEDDGDALEDEDLEDEGEDFDSEEEGDDLEDEDDLLEDTDEIEESSASRRSKRTKAKKALAEDEEDEALEDEEIIGDELEEDEDDEEMDMEDDDEAGDDLGDVGFEDEPGIGDYLEDEDDEDIEVGDALEDEEDEEADLEVEEDDEGGDDLGEDEDLEDEEADLEDEDGDALEDEEAVLEDEDEDGDFYIDDEGSVNIDMVDGAEVEEGDECDVEYSASMNGNKRWIASVNGMPVAIATVATSGTNKDIFHTEKFGTVAKAVIEKSGIAGLKGIGFTSIVVAAPVRGLIQASVSAELSKTESVVAKQLKTLASDYQTAMGMAAAGINRGFFGDVVNPLKVRMWEELSSLGIPQPHRVIDRVFKETAEDFCRVLIEKASELQAKPEAVRAELSKAIIGSNYLAIAEDEELEDIEDDADDLGDAMANRIEAGSMPFGNAPPKRTQVEEANAVVAGDSFTDTLDTVFKSL